MIKPTQNYILVKVEKIPRQSDYGIIVSTEDAPWCKCLILDIGEGVNKEVYRIGQSVIVHVVMVQNASEIPRYLHQDDKLIGDYKLHLIRESDIQAILT